MEPKLDAKSAAKIAEHIARLEANVDACKSGPFQVPNMLNMPIKDIGKLHWNKPFKAVRRSCLLRVVWKKTPPQESTRWPNKGKSTVKHTRCSASFKTAKSLSNRKHAVACLVVRAHFLHLDTLVVPPKVLADQQGDPVLAHVHWSVSRRHVLALEYVVRLLCLVLCLAAVVGCVDLVGFWLVSMVASVLISRHRASWSRDAGNCVAAVCLSLCSWPRSV
jgi:hypothetical protein